MYIEKIITESKGRLRVCTREGADFVLYAKEARQFELEEGKEIASYVYSRLLEEIFIPRAKKRAMHILERMDQTTSQLRDKLMRSGYPREAVESAVSYVESFHYLDDERYARNFIRFYQQDRSRMRLMRDLQQRGIDKELIARCLEEEFEIAEEEQIRRILRKKGYTDEKISRKERDKICRFLMGRGYRSGDIRKVLEADYTVCRET